MPVHRLIKHNPLFMSDEELAAAFVIRKAELRILADLVRANQGDVNQHALVIGPRGMGKTMLMRRLALLVRSDETLKASWYPILAPEEIYDAATEGEIWLAILKSLADQQRREDGDFERWNERYEVLLREQDEERLRARTLGALTEFSHERGKRLLVLIENLQMLLGEQFVKDADWDLRKTMLNRPEIMLVLTATTRFEQIDEPAFAAYELFRDLELQPLSADGCRRLWQAVSGQDLGDQRIRPMEILTGGNPRLLAVLATFAPERPLQELMAHLAELIDDHTPFLKSNIDALPSQERRVFVNLAKLWEPSTARRVGQRCRLNSNTASAVLKSLVYRGAVVECGKEGRANLYQVAERIYCVYYLMRLAGSQADRMRAFVRFMVPLYGEDRLALSLAEAACRADVRDRIRFIEGYRQLLSESAPEGIRQRVIDATPSAFLDLPEAKDLVSTGAPTESPFERTLESTEGLSKQAQGITFVNKGTALAALGWYEEAVEAWDEVVRRFADAEDTTQVVAGALVNKGAALSFLDRHEEAVEAWDEVVRRFADAENTVLLQVVALALCNKGSALYSLDRYEEAIEACNDVVRRFAGTQDTALLVLVAQTLAKKGGVLRQLGWYEEAIEAWDDVVRRFADAEDTTLLQGVARALVNKGVALHSLGRYKEAIDVGSDVVRRFADAEDTTLLEGVAMALVNKGAVLGSLGRYEEAVEAWDDVVRRFADAEDTDLLGVVAQALNGKSWLFYSAGVGRLEEAIEAGEKAVVLAPKDDRDIRHTLASVYSLAGRWDDAFDQVAFLVDDEDFVQAHLDEMLTLLIEAAADGQAERALKALSGTAAERALEPLMVALKELAGEKYRAPREVEEVKKDVLVRIEERRQALRELRARRPAA